MSDLTRRGFIGLAGVALGASATRLLPTPQVAAVDCTPTATPQTLFGACAMKGSTSDSIVTRWGQGAAGRIFRSATFDNPTTNPGFGIVHTSYKPTPAAVNSGSLDAAITATAKATPAGHVLEIWHEADRQVALGTYTFAEIRDAKNRFFRLVEAANPQVLVANTFTGWRWDYKSKYDTAPWGTVNGHILGIDFDGVRPTALPYTNYDDETNGALTFIDRYAAAGYRWFSAPEFGCPRVSSDPDGIERAKYIRKYADLWKATGRCLYVCAYEFDSSPGYSLTKPAEFNAWKSYI
jgi:hypothetical protein